MTQPNQVVGRIEQLTTELKTASPFRSAEIARELLDATTEEQKISLAQAAAFQERQRCLAIARYIRGEVVNTGEDPALVAQRIISLIEDGRTVEKLLATGAETERKAEIRLFIRETREARKEIDSHGCRVEAVLDEGTCAGCQVAEGSIVAAGELESWLVEHAQGCTCEHGCRCSLVSLKGAAHHKSAVAAERLRCLAIVRHVENEVAHNREECGTAEYRIMDMISSGRTLEELLSTAGG